MTTADTPYRRAGAAARGWRTFRRWRRGRPFWGGLITILSGVVYFVSGHLTLGGVKIVFSPQEFLGWVIPLMLLLCGLLMLLTPGQRIFYGVLAAAIAVGGLIGLNFGGFVVGMVLGMVGGALGASWAPVALPPVTPPVELPSEDGDTAGDYETTGYVETTGYDQPAGQDPAGYGAEPHAQWAGGTGEAQWAPEPAADGWPLRGPLTDTLPTSMVSPLAVPAEDAEAGPATGEDGGDGPDPRGLTGGRGPGGGPLPRRSPRGFLVVLLVMTTLAVGLAVARVQSPAAAAPACVGASVAAAVAKKPATARTATGKTATGKPATTKPATTKPATGTAPTGAAATSPNTPTAQPSAPTVQATPTPTGTGGPAGPVSQLVNGVLAGIGHLLGLDAGTDPSASPSAPPSAGPSASPSPSPSPSPSASPTGTAPTAAPTATGPTVHPSATPSTAASCPAAPLIAPGDQTIVNQNPSEQITASLTQVLLTFDGVTDLRTVGGTIRVLQFSMGSSTSTPFELRVPVAGGHTMSLRSTQLTVSGNVRFYTTKLVGNLLGALPQTYTPDSPPPLPAGLLVPALAFTDVTIQLVLVHADKLTAPGLAISYIA